MHSLIESQFEILDRICVRGKNYFFDKQDSLGIDLFEHMQQEVERTRLYLEKYGGTTTLVSNSRQS